MSTVPQGKVEGKRDRGRPPSSLARNTTDISGKKLWKVVRLSRDQDGLRQFVRTSYRAASTVPDDTARTAYRNNGQYRPVLWRPSVLLCEPAKEQLIETMGHYRPVLWRPSVLLSGLAKEQLIETMGHYRPVMWRQSVLLCELAKEQPIETTGHYRPVMWRPSILLCEPAKEQLLETTGHYRE
ncbi:hypothetical protein ElyMa_006605300 [Elysia marginata]|uniref:Uncharacterized protein n=1 Tax=Elysia marginata TaxID=1093978 RepID=A0AAV4IJE9_9GAST|nr:hypothetical protein ElyMa_006605300 [Elysia marginata]